MTDRTESDGGAVQETDADASESIARDGGAVIDALRRVQRLVHEHNRIAFVAAILFCLVLPFGFRRSIVYVLSLMFLYAGVGYAVIISIGYGGQLILSFGAFFGVGAYSFVKLTEAGVPTIAALLAGMVITTVIAYLLGRVAIRAEGIYLGIITITFNEAFVIALQRFDDFTGGTKGMSAPDLFAWVQEIALPSEFFYYYLAVAFFFGAYLVFMRILRSDIGLSLMSIQNNRHAAASLGIDTRKYRMLTFTMAGAVCGLGGALYAPLNGYISPSMFNLDATVQIILGPVFGGIQAPAWVILGSVVSTLVPELLRVIGEFRFVLYGLMLIVLLIYLPVGLGGYVRRRLSGRR